ncbi:MAG: crossover junction endodeoxyribonuclease RuvC [Spirochaetaceae bacterium]|nr:crossover junction endodeoxyribonuclease RuvC [Spirochaetaceae bacterium]
MRRVLGIDPGLGSTGYAVLDYARSRYRLASSGTIETPPGAARGERLNMIYEALSLIIGEFKPSEAGMETLFFARNVTSALAVSEAKGVLALCLHRRGVPLFEYRPNAIKLAVTGSARADKRAVQEYVRLLLGLESPPKSDHESDAIACAITHLHITP